MSLEVTLALLAGANVIVWINIESKSPTVYRETTQAMP